MSTYSSYLRIIKDNRKRLESVVKKEREEFYKKINNNKFADEPRVIDVDERLEVVVQLIDFKSSSGGIFVNRFLEGFSRKLKERRKRFFGYEFKLEKGNQINLDNINFGRLMYEKDYRKLPISMAFSETYNLMFLLCDDYQKIRVYDSMTHKFKYSIELPYVNMKKILAIDGLNCVSLLILQNQEAIVRVEIPSECGDLKRDSLNKLYSTSFTEIWRVGSIGGVQTSYLSDFDIDPSSQLIYASDCTFLAFHVIDFRSGCRLKVFPFREKYSFNTTNAFYQATCGQLLVRCSSDGLIVIHERCWSISKFDTNLNKSKHILQSFDNESKINDIYVDIVQNKFTIIDDRGEEFQTFNTDGKLISKHPIPQEIRNVKKLFINPSSGFAYPLSLEIDELIPVLK